MFRTDMEEQVMKSHKVYTAEVFTIELQTVVLGAGRATAMKTADYHGA